MVDPETSFCVLHTDRNQIRTISPLETRKHEGFTIDIFMNTGGRLGSMQRSKFGNELSFHLLLDEMIISLKNIPRDGKRHVPVLLSNQFLFQRVHTQSRLHYAKRVIAWLHHIEPARVSHFRLLVSSPCTESFTKKSCLAQQVCKSGRLFLVRNSFLEDNLSFHMKPRLSIQ